MKQTDEEAALKVALWWSEKSFSRGKIEIREKGSEIEVVDNRHNQNIGGTTRQEENVNILLNLVSEKALGKVGKENIKKFEDKLVELLLKAKPGRERTLSVDYDPCDLLFQAVQFAEIDSHCLPVKSHTRIDENNRVFAKYQYGGSEIEI